MRCLSDVCSYAVMRSRLIVLFIAVFFGLALAIENNPDPAREVAAGLARAAAVGVILGSNAWAPVPTDVQSRLLLQQAFNDAFLENPEQQYD
jgi:hypothetical protein